MLRLCRFSDISQSGTFGPLTRAFAIPVDRLGGVVGDGSAADGARHVPWMRQRHVLTMRQGADGTIVELQKHTQTWSG